MKKSILILLVVLLVSVFALSGCSNTEDADTTPKETVADVAEVTVGEDDAKAIALEDAGIPETAANNLAIESGEFDGQKAYVITFEWSGFDYQYTISATTGEIVEEIFDGDVIE